MTAYAAPLPEMRFVLREIAGLDEIARLPGFEDATPELANAAVEEASRLAAEVLAPLNRPGDQQGSILENGVVRTPAGFRDAYRRFVEGGWNGVQCDPEYGGQGLPWAFGTALQEMWASANMAFSLCPLLTQGAIELLQAHGSPEQKGLYLEKMIAGRWTGTMNLTEPVAGSDVGALRTRAVRDGDTYRITGQKIFITYGEHDLAENIVHMVLARTPDAAPGTKGISLFIVPKFLPNPDGSLGQRNDLRCASIEHKLGIKASPTCVLAFGDDGGARGWLVGEENRGMEYMFTMMNSARLGVGLEGVAIAERAYQQARDFARLRTQGRDALRGSGDAVPIVRHPDVRRMLLSMRAQTEAARALAYYAAGLLDRAKRDPDSDQRRRDQALVDLLIPIVKAWCTDVGVEVASTGIQVHGGMGFIEETGAAQHYRDARITPIYEGTNGIQALDLLGRKLMRDRGETMRAFIGMMGRIDAELASGSEDVATIRGPLAEGVRALATATEWLGGASRDGMGGALAGATNYLKLAGYVAGGWLLARGALAAERRLDSGDADAAFLTAKIRTARFYAEQILPSGIALLGPIVSGGRIVLEFDEAQF